MKQGDPPLAQPKARFDLPLFAEQRQSYELRFTCEHCAYFVAEGERCCHGYPNHEHRAARYEQGSAELVFCKEFELR